jgi:zinc/manganese transport system substrate-binding protein
MARRAAALTAIILGGLALTACGTSGAATAPAGTVRVVTSTDVWGSVVSAVGGKYVDVTAIIHDPSQDPHDYQTSPADAATIGKAQLAVYNGDGYDDFFATDLTAVTSGNLPTVVAFDLSGRAATKDSNEHVFYDLPTVAKVATEVAARLGRLQPAHAADFTHNAAAFDKGVDALLATVRQIGARHPGLRAVVTEPVADYLLQAAGVADATPPAFERAVESDTDVPVAALNDTMNLITGRQVAVLVNNSQAQTDVTTQLDDKAKGAGVPVVNVTETLPQGATGYLAWMTAQVTSLSSASMR